MKRLLLLLFCSFVYSAYVNAQPVPPPYSSVAGYANVSATATSGRIHLTANLATFGALTFYNSGDKDVYFAIGGSGVVATTSPSGVGQAKVPAGTFLTVYAIDAYVAFICGGTDSTSVEVYQASGPLQFGK